MAASVWCGGRKGTWDFRFTHFSGVPKGGSQRRLGQKPRSKGLGVNPDSATDVLGDVGGITRHL